MIPNGPFIIPVQPFNAKRLTAHAKILNDVGVEWEFDWLTQDQADELIPLLKNAGILR